VSTTIGTRGYEGAADTSVSIATRGYIDDGSGGLALQDDTYKAKLMRRTIPRPFASTFASVVGQIVSALGDADNDLGGLFGTDDFLPNKDLADATVHVAAAYPSSPTVTVLVPVSATTAVSDGVDTYKEKLMRRGFPRPFRATYLSTLGSLLSAIGGSDNDIGGLFGTDDFLGVVQ
jgi:hypothetical protein